MSLQICGFVGSCRPQTFSPKNGWAFFRHRNVSGPPQDRNICPRALPVQVPKGQGMKATALRCWKLAGYGSSIKPEHFSFCHRNFIRFLDVFRYLCLSHSQHRYHSCLTDLLSRWAGFVWGFLYQFRLPLPVSDGFGGFWIMKDSLDPYTDDIDVENTWKYKKR